MRRLVVDANILASGSADPHTKSPPSLILAAAEELGFEAIVCPRILEEIAEALRKPYFRERIRTDEIADIVGAIAAATRVLEDPTDVDAVLRDPDDDYLIALARESGAEAIVTGDRDLLDHAGLDPPAIDARRACELLGLIG